MEDLIMNKVSGVYQFVCLRNGHKYVGSTTNLAHRKRQHFSDLKTRRHGNPRLQKDYDEFGKAGFSFSILELATPDNLLDVEQKWIDLLLPEYNAELKAGKSTSHVSKEEVKEKISNSVRELWKDEEYRKQHCKPRNWKRGVPPRTGVKLSDEEKQKLREMNLGENNPNYGLHRSEETKRIMSAKMAKTYAGAVSPDGEIFAPIHHMRNFCKEHDLGESSMVALMHGRIKQHKGWTKFSE
jgi:group I intron endonuclease